ncbi:MAG: Fic family protein [Alphaproteobacteria bacterium]|nr:Fic family protein [Alphaproteobacteria bacterium]
MVWMPKYTITQAILRNLSEIEAIKNYFADKVFSPSLVSSLRQSAKIAQTHYSTRIEGNRLTLNQVETALYTADKSARSYQGHDEKEVRAYYEAINYMEKYLNDGGIFSLALIKKIHSLIMGSHKIIPYRNAQNAVYDSADGSIIYLPPETKDVAKMMRDLAAWVKDNIDKLPPPVVAGLFHYQFVTIHPYFDGNGRTARLITSFIMRKSGYDLQGLCILEEYYAKNLSTYYQALMTHPHHNYYFGRNNADLTPWLAYFIEGVSQTFADIKAKTAEQVHSTKVLPALRNLNLKQKKILGLLKEFAEITSIQAGLCLGISPQSARLLLNKWKGEGFLKIVNTPKKNRTYGLSDEYEELLFPRG